MREVAPGDLVFSFCGGEIRAFGIARGHAYECPKPDFGSAGRNWDEIGWRVDVRFHEAAKPFHPRDWMPHLALLLPERYSPLQEDGRGVQNLYLTLLSRELGLAIAELLGLEVAALAREESVMEGLGAAPVPEVLLWEEHLERRLKPTRVCRRPSAGS